MEIIRNEEKSTNKLKPSCDKDSGFQHIVCTFELSLISNTIIPINQVSSKNRTRVSVRKFTEWLWQNLFLKTMHVIRLFVIFLWTMDKCNAYCTCNCFLFIYLILNFVPTRWSISALHRRDRSAGSSTLFWLQDSPCRFCTPNHYRTKDAEMVPKLIWISMFARIYLATLSKYS